MKTDTIEIDVKTSGFKEATEEIKGLAEAYDGFPSQICIKNAKECTFNIYPSQTYIQNNSEEQEHDCGKSEEEKE